ncbi:DUF2125 domain-containing protein [Rhizomicrobium electricum]|uniref:DUF2125 domain-containing protein n=1 Tax=Rhizomicrobium electricum TaxID=480070 RepID=A0ABN1F493_9PROT|nr:DUF2125 domain-containing protein [Rhizomicrobium electricum]NIJ49379.1 hypothetical protein [Rhizomicrobium electricum]
MKYSSRFFLYAPLGVFLILCVAAGVHWWAMASSLSRRLDAVNGHQAMPGVTVSFAAKKIGGFPFSLDTEFTGFAVSVATPDGPTRWRSEKFAMHALTYGRDETIFEAAGKQQLRWGQGHRLDFAVGALRASAILRQGALDRFDLDLIGFGSKAFVAQRLQLHARKEAATVQMFVTADGLTNCRRNAIRTAATVAKAEAFARLQRAEASWTDAVAGWRAAGGIVPTDKPNPLSDIAAEDLLNPSALANAACGA